MELEPFADKLVASSPPDAVQDASEIPSNEVQLKARAVVELLRNKVLSHTFGDRREYEVRTTLMTYGAWFYRCIVLHYGRVIEDAFPTVEVDRTRDMQKARVITEEMRIAFAAEAVDTHFTLRAAVQEYFVLASVFSQPPPRGYRPPWMLVAVLICIALTAAYWIWNRPFQLPTPTPSTKASLRPSGSSSAAPSRLGSQVESQSPPLSAAIPPAATPLPADGIGMVTGSKTSTYLQFGQEIAKMAHRVGVNILVKESAGSLDNVRRLVSAENAALAIVQSDVVGFLGRSADPELRRIPAGRLRLIYPFFTETVHLLARADIRRFEDLNGRRVVVGTQGGDNWLTAHNLLRMVNVKPAEHLELPPAEAISAVLTGQAEAMFYVVDKPANLFTAVSEVQKDARYAHLTQDIHFVPLTHAAMLREYVASSIGPQDYAWLGGAVPTVAVKAVLISFDFSSRKDAHFQKRCEELGRLGQAMRENFAELQRTGHPKWREVDLDRGIGIWKQDSCSQATRRPPQRAPRTGDDLSKAVTEILKSKGRVR